MTNLLPLTQRLSVVAFVLAVLLLGRPSLASAQDGSIDGRVVDPQGGAVANAAVVLEPRTGPARATASAADGAFRFDAVPPGTYSLVVKADGFAESRKSLTHSRAATRLDVTVEVGTVDESIRVIGTSPTLETKTETGSRVGLTRLETPATVMVLSGDEIRERGDRTVEEAETRMVGVSTQGNLGNGGGVRMSRGFGGANSMVRLYDGNQMLVGQGTVTFPFDGWTVERIEYLAGPASVMYGSGAIGGAINVIPRKPAFANTQTAARLTAGSDNTWRIGAGHGGPINDRFAYRLDLSHNRSDGYVERGEWQTTAVSTALGIKAKQGLLFTVSNDFGYQEPMAYWGSPLINGQLDESLREENYNVLDAVVEYRDNWSQVKADWQITNNLAFRANGGMLATRRQWTNTEQYTFQPASTLVNRSSYTEIIQYLRQYTGHADVLSTGTVFGRSNTVSVGFDYNWFSYQRDRNAGSFSTLVPLDNPSPGLFFNTTPTSPEYRAIQNRYAVYVEDRVALGDKVSLVGALRADHYDVEREDLRVPGTTSKKVTPVNGRGGVVFAPRPSMSVYGQYASATDPVNTLISLTPAEQQFDLTPARQFEAGAKQAILNGRGEWTVAAYHIVKEKLLVPDPDDSLRRLQVGQQSSRGIELSTVFTVISRVRIDANASFLDARYDDFSELVSGVLTSWDGKTPTNTPQQTANLWVTYTPVAQWQVLGGVRYIGSRYLDNANTTTTPEVALADAGVRHRFGRTFAVDLRVNNLFDKFYLVGATGVPVPVRGRYGAPRTAEVTFDVQF